MINIKFKVFDEDIKEMQNLSKENFQKEYTSIYGNYCMVVNNNGYPLLYPDDLIYSDLEVSELISTHINSLITVYNNLDTYNSVYIKYVENSHSWLQVKRVNEVLYISDIVREYEDEMNNYLVDGYALLEDRFFNDVEVVWGEIKVFIDEFRQEVVRAATLLSEVIGDINPEFLDTSTMRGISEFVKLHR